MEIRIGGSVLFNWWNPYWSNGTLLIYHPEFNKIIDRHAPRYPSLREIKYGPDIAMKFLRQWELSPSYHYATCSVSGGNTILFPYQAFRRIDIDIKHHDVYVTLGYYFFDFLKLFAGLRFELLKHTYRYRHMDFEKYELFHTKMEGQTLNFTPEVGVNFTAKLSSIFAMLFSLSGTFQSGMETGEYRNSWGAYGPDFLMSKIPTARYYALGCNTSLAVRADIPVINTSIVLCGYYRILGYMQKSSDQGVFILDKSIDNNYGFSLSASYIVSFDEHTRRRVWVPRPEYDR